MLANAHPPPTLVPFATTSLVGPLSDDDYYEVCKKHWLPLIDFIRYLLNDATDDEIDFCVDKAFENLRKYIGPIRSLIGFLHRQAQWRIRDCLKKRKQGLQTVSLDELSDRSLQLAVTEPKSEDEDVWPSIQSMVNDAHLTTGEAEVIDAMRHCLVGLPLETMKTKAGQKALNEAVAIHLGKTEKQICPLKSTAIDKLVKLRAIQRQTSQPLPLS